MGFVHLHLHTEYSLLDGACRIDRLISHAKSLGQTALAITDHGVMYGALRFYDAAVAAGIKPIIGCEVYVANRSRFDRVHELDASSSHLVLLCKNQTGYENLCKLVSLAFTEGFYGKPRVDHELLEQYHDGLIALSACLQGEIQRAITRGDVEKAKTDAIWYRNTFGEGNFYLELQDHGIREQMHVNAVLMQISDETGIPLVATNDVHYVEKQDSKMQKTLILIGTNHTINDDDTLEFETEEFYLKSEEEMRELFPQVPDAIDNTELIAEQCNLEFTYGEIKLPRFEIEGNPDHYTYFKEQCYAGLHRLFNTPSKEYIDRLEYEISVIEKMGYVDYYLIVADFVNYAKSQKIPVGPGRGSGAASLAAYCIGITDIDPIKYQLLFERFLNPERVSMPDFDIDFCYIRRQEVIDYVIRRYGSDRVAQIVAFSTMAARAAVRDVGRALAIPYNTVDTVAKLIPFMTSIDKALDTSSDLKSLYDKDSQIRELIDMARKIEGMPRHASTHAAGVVITDKQVSSYCPLAKNDEAVVTQFTMTDLEKIGLLKMDFLGLRNLTIIEDCAKIIQKTAPDFSIDSIDLDDAPTFKMMSGGYTDGVFQFESSGMKRVLRELKPTSLEDLIAVISLYRPGPMQSIPKYIENRHNPEKITYATPLLKPILEVTYGCLIYQEQVMQVFRDLAGYSFGRADIVRRAMAKKKHDVLEKERVSFIEGCRNAGISEKTATELFDEISAFSSYAFNKAHAAAYATVSYRTAYLKCHYPTAYMAALLSSELDRTDKVVAYIDECSKMGIRLLPPHVNYSDNDFAVSGDDIRFGLQSIKNLGFGMITQLIQSRNNSGPFKSIYDFCDRLYGKDMNKRALESLIKAGALDGLGANRREMLGAIGAIFENIESKKRRNVDGQIGFFEVMQTEDEGIDFQIPKQQEMEKAELLRMEKEVTGLYFSGHPMSAYKNLVSSMNCAAISDLLKASEENAVYQDNQRVQVLAMISGVHKKTTKSNDTMAFVTLEDTSSEIEMLVFPKIYVMQTSLFSEGNILLVTARISIREEQRPQLVCEKAETAPAPKSLFLRVRNFSDEAFIKAQEILRMYKGRIPVFVYNSETSKTVKLKEIKVSDSDLLMQNLQNTLGADNVKMKQA